MGLTFQKSLRGSRSVFEGFQECLYGVFRLWSRESLRGSRASLRECVKEEFLIFFKSVLYLHGVSQVCLEVPRLLYDDLEELSGALSEFWTYSGGFPGSFMGFKLCHDRL